MKKYLLGLMACMALWLACGGGDSEAPIVQIVSPINGSTVSGTVNITINATDNEAVESVNVYIDDTLVETCTSEPYLYSWITDSLPNNSSHDIIAKAYDAADNEGISQTITVSVFNDTLASSVFIWNYDPLDTFEDSEAGGLVDCAYWLEQALLANGYSCDNGSSLPADLDSYEIVFVTLGWFRC